MKILYVGPLWFGSTSLQRMYSLQVIGHHIHPIDTLPARILGLQHNLLWRVANRLYRGFDWAGANSAIINAVGKQPFDVLWLDKALKIRPQTLMRVKSLSPKIIIVGYSPDDMAGSHNQTQRFLKSLKYYDVFFTTKTYGVSELKAMGCKDVRFVNNAYDPDTHKPCQISEKEKQALGGQVGFIGDYERERAEAIRFLADNGIKVRIWGTNWNKMPPHRNIITEGRPLWGDNYAKAICSFDINLCFLRKINRDLQTTRSIEIPACGAFMLAEQTTEHLMLFEDGKEAAFFFNNEELLQKCNYYLKHETERRNIAFAGMKRCLSSGYDNNNVIASMMDTVKRIATYHPAENRGIVKS